MHSYENIVILFLIFLMLVWNKQGRLFVKKVLLWSIMFVSTASICYASNSPLLVDFQKDSTELGGSPRKSLSHTSSDPDGNILKEAAEACQFRLMVENEFDIMNADIANQAYICDVLVYFKNENELVYESFPFDKENRISYMNLPKKKMPSIILLLRRKAEEPKGSGMQTIINFVKNKDHWLTQAQNVVETPDGAIYSPLMKPFRTEKMPNSLKLKVYFYAVTEHSSVHILQENFPLGLHESELIETPLETTRDLIVFDELPCTISFSTEP